MKTCLICDDHAMMREALAGAVSIGWPDAAIAQAPDFPSAWSAAEARPDLIISDLVMPGAAPADAPPPPAAGATRLTERQVDVLKLTALGQSNKEIARELDLSPATIKAHIAAAIAALGAANRTDAVVRAHELRLI